MCSTVCAMYERNGRCRIFVSHILPGSSPRECTGSLQRPAGHLLGSSHASHGRALVWCFGHCSRYWHWIANDRSPTFAVANRCMGAMAEGG
jgi:hypothetical protein